jgi:hypothetical protein
MICSLKFERVKKEENRKVMLGCVEIANGLTKDDKEFRVYQSENRNVITIEQGGFYNHVILKNIIYNVLSASEPLGAEIQ